MSRQLRKIYFIQEGYDGNVKIGISKDPGVRLNTSLQIGNSRLLRVVGYAVGTAAQEDKIHKLLAQYATPSSEWFFPVPEIANMLRFVHMQSGIEDIAAYPASLQAQEIISGLINSRWKKVLTPGK